MSTPDRTRTCNRGIRNRIKPLPRCSLGAISAILRPFRPGKQGTEARKVLVIGTVLEYRCGEAASSSRQRDDEGRYFMVLECRREPNLLWRQGRSGTVRDGSRRCIPAPLLGPCQPPETPRHPSTDLVTPPISTTIICPPRRRWPQGRLGTVRDGLSWYWGAGGSRTCCGGKDGYTCRQRTAMASSDSPSPAPAYCRRDYAARPHHVGWPGAALAG